MSAIRRKRHKWDPSPERLDFETVRHCTVCGLRKVTDHSGALPRIYYLERASTELLDVMPECDAVE